MKDIMHGPGQGLITIVMVVGCLVINGGVFVLAYWLAKACGHIP